MAKRFTPLIKNISQFEVDFVIPLVGADIQLGIDPFLLFKSRDKNLSALHNEIISFFDHSVDLIKRNKISRARELLRFPEVREIGLGYTERGKAGSGVGEILGDSIIDALCQSPDFLERGIKHVEEVQLISVGIGRDRISDITGNLIKQYLIEYTQQQSQLWNIEMKTDVPVENIFDSESMEWVDGYYDLPISEFDQTAMIFVPRRIVRVLPWINYAEFSNIEFSAFLRAKKQNQQSRHTHATYKPEIVSISRRSISKIENYVNRKEASASEAQPSVTYLNEKGICPHSEKLKKKLTRIEAGRAEASIFQRTVLEIINFLFNPELIDGRMEERTIDGTERRDIIFINDSDNTFWRYVRNKHSSFLIMFEAKNTDNLKPDNFNQTNTYMGNALGRLAFIVSRKGFEKNTIKRRFRYTIKRLNT